MGDSVERGCPNERETGSGTCVTSRYNDVSPAYGDMCVSVPQLN